MESVASSWVERCHDLKKQNKKNKQTNIAALYVLKSTALHFFQDTRGAMLPVKPSLMAPPRLHGKTFLPPIFFTDGVKFDWLHY